jgi:putative ABC transport system substrate-binding protein
MEPKRIGLLHELVPSASSFGALINPAFPPAVRQLGDIENATKTIRQSLFVARASTDAELNAAFASFVQQPVGAVLIAADPYFDTRREQIIALAAQARLPTMYQFREFAVAGGLISYGPSYTDSYKQAGGQISRLCAPQNAASVDPTTHKVRDGDQSQDR